MRVSYFAKRWKVSTKTVRRDLEAFRKLGQRMSSSQPGRPTAEELEDPDHGGWVWRGYAWRYKPGVDPLFTANSVRK